MKYTYAYKTSDGVRHVAEINAESRDAVFETLRKQGIRAIKVVAADGSKANGEIRGVRKRMVALAVIIAAIFAGSAVFFAQGTRHKAQGTTTAARPIERQQIPGDRERVEKALVAAFQSPAESFLARFAEPGRAFSAPESDWPKKADFDAVLDQPILISDGEFTESIDLKRIVLGMKREMSAYLKGGGLVSGYIRELIKRQQMEVAYRQNAEKKLDQLLAPPSMGSSNANAGAILDNQIKNAYDFWLKANAQLQALGIYPLPLPARLWNYQMKMGLED